MVVTQVFMVTRRFDVCLRLFITFAVYFFALSICSIVEYCRMWNLIAGADWFVLFSILQNLFLTYFFYGVMTRMVIKKRNHLSNPVDRTHILSEIQYQSEDYDLSTVLFYLIRKRYSLFKINQTLFVVMFLLGFSRLYEPDNQLERWYMVTELALGFLIFGVLITLMTAACIIAPFTLCCHFARRNNGNQNFNFHDLEDEDQPHIELPAAVIFSSLTVDPTQPCYICLQDY